VVPLVGYILTPTVYEGSFFLSILTSICWVLFLIMAIPTQVRCNLSVALIYISFVAKDVEHFFLVGLRFELRASCLQKRCSTA
jgi:hypothetical protein